MPKPRMHAGDDRRGVDRTRLAESLVVMLVAAILYGYTYTFAEVPAILAQGIQPTVFPRAILLLLFGLALLQAFRSLRLTPAELARRTAPAPVAPVVGLTVGLLVAFAVLMPVIGTFPAVVLFLPALALLWGERRWLLMALGFAGFTGFAWVLFRLVMQVPLP